MRVKVSPGESITIEVYDEHETTFSVWPMVSASGVDTVLAVRFYDSNKRVVERSRMAGTIVVGAGE